MISLWKLLLLSIFVPKQTFIAQSPRSKSSLYRSTGIYTPAEYSGHFNNTFHTHDRGRGEPPVIHTWYGILMDLYRSPASPPRHQPIRTSLLSILEFKLPFAFELLKQNMTAISVIEVAPPSPIWMVCLDFGVQTQDTIRPCNPGTQGDRRLADIRCITSMIHAYFCTTSFPGYWGTRRQIRTLSSYSFMALIVGSQGVYRGRSLPKRSSLKTI